MHGHGVDGGLVLKECRRRSDDEAAGLRAPAGCAPACAAVIGKIVVCELAPAAVVVALVVNYKYSFLLLDAA